MVDSEFGKIEKRDAIYFIALAIGSGLLFSFNVFHPVLRILLIFVLLYQAYKDPFCCWGTYIITQRYIGLLFSTYISVAVFFILFLSFFIRNPYMIRKMRGAPILLIGLPLIIISILVGKQSNISTGVFMGIILLIILAILNYSDLVSRDDTTKIAFAYCCGALSVAIYFVIAIVTHVNILKYGRLNFFGDIKPIAFAAFIPLLLIVSSRLEGKKCFENIDSKFLDSILVVIYSSMIILTAARGMIFAGIIALLIQAVFSSNKLRAIWKLFPVVILVAVFIFMTIASNDLRVARIFDFQGSDFGSLNGRSFAWKEYLELFKEGSILRKLFGFGPGDSGRLISLGLYTHSTYLDYLISYGIVGFITMVVYEIIASVKILKKKDIVLLIVLVFSIVAESTHGNSANFVLLSLHVFLVLCVVANNKSDISALMENYK